LNQFQPGSQFQARGATGFQGQQNVSPQSYHTANYRGNQPGHDNNLRADSTQPSTPNARGGYQSRSFTAASSVGAQSSFGSQQSFGQSTGGAQPQFGQQQFSQQSGQQQFGQQPSPQSYHTANYRGDQPGHDNSKRADSTQPSTPNAQGGYQGRGVQSSFGSQQQFGQSAAGVPSYSQQAGSQSYHTANYRGNQQGQSRGFTASAPSSAGVQSSFGSQPQFSQSSFGGQQQFGQQGGPQSYHTANYRGNQPGHDNFKRADSTQPSTTNAQGGYQSRGFTTTSPVNVFGAQSSFAAGQQPSNRA
jgi:hypothetical protein